MVVHESLVCSEQFKLSSVLQENPACPADPVSFAYLNPFQQWLYAFDTEDNWGTQTQLFKQVQTFTDAPEGNTMH